MKRLFLIDVLLFSLVLSEVTYNITYTDSMCGGDGSGLIILGVEAEESTDLPREFNIKLKSNQSESYEISASCIFDISTDSTDIFYKTDDTDINSSDIDFSDEFEPDDEEKENEKEIENLINPINNNPNDPNNNPEPIIEGGNLRLLKSDSNSEKLAFCYIEPPEEKTKYTIELEDDSPFVFADESLKTVEAIHCISQAEAEERMKITLTFRQVSKFNITNFLFYFYGLTSQPIPAEYNFRFFFYLMSGSNKLPTKQECICTVENAVELDTEKKMGAAPFKCEFVDKTLTGFDSIQIAIPSEFVAGLPENSTLLNPKLTDDAIASGLLPDFSTVTTIPPLVEEPDIIFGNVREEGTFEMTINMEETGNLKKGQVFTIPLTFPSGVFIFFTITGIESNKVTFKGEINGRVFDDPLIFEQTSVVVGGVELFVLPAFETDPITTEGVEKKDEEEETSETDNEESSTEEESSDTNTVDTTEIIQTTVPGGNSSETDTSEEEEEDSPRTKEDAEKKAQIFISFRQLNTFTFKPGTISFYFLALTSQALTKGSTITLNVNLIGSEGMDDETKEIQCTLESDVDEPSEGESSQGNYKCELSGLNTSINYTSVRLDSSDDIVGIPTDDETALNPALTDEAIKNGEVKNCTKDSSVPPTFSFKEINSTQCSTNGKFTIKGSVSNNKKIAANKFTIPLTYPEGTSMTCNFIDGNLECIADKELEEIIMEQTIVSEGAEEIFILRNLSSDRMNCKNGLEAKAEEKSNVDISFRQVSKIKEITNGLSFFFAAFVKTNLEASYSIPMNVFVIINGQKVEKEANCTLKEAVESSGTPVQGDFDCVVPLESNETVAPENLTVSTNNDNIGGCSELTKEEASPNLTDYAIEETKDKPDLGKVLDFSLAENKEQIPVTFEISAMDLDKCEKKGKLKVTGKFTEDIEEEKTFEIPFTFPAYRIKCTVDPVAKDTTTDIICKMQKTKKFFTFKSLVLEPRLLKKKKMEMFYIKKFKHEASSEKSCENYNDIKLKRAKARKNAPFSFLQIARPPSYGHLFFIALLKKSSETFENRTINISLTIVKNSRRRVLDTLDLSDELEVSCSVGNTEGDAGALDCSNSEMQNSNVTKADIEDTDIGGSTDEVEVEKNPNPDYSKAESLKAVNDLATVKITNIESTNCASAGTYTITGTLTGTLNESLYLDNVNIPFSTPDSSGVCSISGDTELTIKCDNTEEFKVSQITVPAQVINDNAGNPVFRIPEDFTAPTQFACAISENSTRTSGADGEEEGVARRYYNNKSSSGLSGGAIAAIVICSVAAVAIVGVIAVLMRKNIYSGPKVAMPDSSIDNTTVNKFMANNEIPKV